MKKTVWETRPKKNKRSPENFDQKGFDSGTSQGNSSHIAVLTFSIRDSYCPHSLRK
jgi:hypothetical protein